MSPTPCPCDTCNGGTLVEPDWRAPDDIEDWPTIGEALGLDDDDPDPLDPEFYANPDSLYDAARDREDD